MFGDLSGSALGFQSSSIAVSRNERNRTGRKAHLRPILDGWCCEGRGERAFASTRSAAFTAWEIQCELTSVRNSTSSLSSEIDSVRRGVASIPRSTRYGF